MGRIRKQNRKAGQGRENSGVNLTPREPPKRRFLRFGTNLLAFVFGMALMGIVGLIYSKTYEFAANLSHSSSLALKDSNRGVEQFIALTDSDLENVDLLEMNIAVAKGIPGLEKLDYNHYRQIIDGWTDQFRRWLPTVEYAFHQSPKEYKNDINFFRLGMLAQFLDQKIGVHYVEEQKQVQLEAKARGKKAEIKYTNPRDLLIYGLIDAKQGTCVTMPTLHVIIGRRMGWPVGLACIGSHYICRYDDGKVIYNIEATDTGRGGFAASSDKEYLDKHELSKKAVDSGSDLRKLTAREMLSVFLSARARHFADTDRLELADRDYALSRVLYPFHRQAYMESVNPFMKRGEMLFDTTERGHPNSILAAILPQRAGSPGRGPDLDSIEEVNRINVENRARSGLVTDQGISTQNYRSSMLPADPMHSAYPQTNPMQTNYPQ
jgi:Transglutaminase-like superfamily